MRQFEIQVSDDGEVRRVGLQTGKTTIVAHNKDRKLLAMKVAGHKYWSSRSQAYAPASFVVVEYETISYHDGWYAVWHDALFGSLEWPVRAKE